MYVLNDNFKKERCPWCLSDPLYIEYHDKVWGVPMFGSQQLFAFLMLEGMQAGLSWLTILKKQQALEEAFLNFNPTQLADLSDDALENILQNPKIIRNRRKVYAIRQNARAFLELSADRDFSDFIWNFSDGKTLQNNWRSLDEVPAETVASCAMSKDLKSQGFSFVGPKICYAFMQATGMVNDHVVNCFRYES